MADRGRKNALCASPLLDEVGVQAHRGTLSGQSCTVDVVKDELLYKHACLHLTEMEEDGRGGAQSKASRDEAHDRQLEARVRESQAQPREEGRAGSRATGGDRQCEWGGSVLSVFLLSEGEPQACWTGPRRMLD